MIKLVKFLLLIVLIAPTSTYALLRCDQITNQDTCTKTEGCGWVASTGTCTRCGEGEYSGVSNSTCLPCSNGPEDAYYYEFGENNGNNDCPWHYTCKTNERVSCTKDGDTWTCSCGTCTAAGSYKFYYLGDGAEYYDTSSCTVGGAHTVVLKMPSNNTHYEEFPTAGYLFFSPINPSTTPSTKPSTKASTKPSIQTKDTFSLGINDGTAYDLEIKDEGDNKYTWSWTRIDDQSKSGNVTDCEVRDWKRESTCELFKPCDYGGALCYPFAWESKQRLRPDRYYVKKGIAEIDIFTLVTDENKAPSVDDLVLYHTFYAFANDRSNWNQLFKCTNSTDGKCTYYLHAGDWQPWPYTNFSIKYGNKSLFNSATSGSYWDIDDGFDFKDAFKNNNCCVSGEDMPSEVVIRDKINDAEWELTATIPQDDDKLKIVPPYGILFSGFLTINGTVTCPVGHYCNNCEKTECPRAFTSAAGASNEQDCYIKPDITFTDISTGGKDGTKEFGLPACDSSDPDSECVGGKIKVYINTSLE